MLLGSCLITWTSLQYFDLETLPPFALEKFPLRFEDLWLASLRVHVASAIVTFPLCLLLTTRALQRRATVHRWLGRATAIAVLFALVPSGAVLAFTAKGGAVVTAGFLLSGAIIATSLVRGVLAARRREVVAHRHAMHHVVAQMSVAVSSRAMIMGLDALGTDPERAYVLALWVPVLASAAMVELVARRGSAPSLGFSHLLERIRRAFSPPLPLVRARAAVPAVRRLGR
jgi:uncharacterized membrane protein YozB (DUF420 family)